MLAISRKEGDALSIGDDVFVAVVQINKDQINQY